MKSRTFVTIVAAMTLFSTGFAYMPMVHAHGVQAQLQSRFVRILDESFSAQTLHTGDTLTVTGTLQSLVNTPLRDLVIVVQRLCKCRQQMAISSKGSSW